MVRVASAYSSSVRSLSSWPLVVREAAPRYEAGPLDEAGPLNGADAADEADALDELGDEIATLAAHIHAATQRMLLMIAEFDQRGGWKPGGHRSCAHWLAFRTGFDLGACREKVRTARALVGLPETSAAMARGELSFSVVRALTRVATPEHEAELVELARGCTAGQVERLVRGWKLGSREDEAEREAQRYESRGLTLRPDTDGMVVVSGRLTPELGALVMRAIEAASDALYSEDPWRASDDARAQEIARQRRADALGLLAEAALRAGFGEKAPVSGTRAERHTVTLHVDAETLAADGGLGRSELEEGTRVSGETSRRLACDAGLVLMAHAPDGSILDVGRKTRTIPPALRRALEARDRGCRFPGCGSRFCDAHHVIHWADGGETSLRNCLLLCLFHHDKVHKGGWTIRWWGEGRPVFISPRGDERFEGGWEPPTLPDDAAAALVEEQREAGVRPGPLTASACWKTERDIPLGIQLAAMEAVIAG